MAGRVALVTGGGGGIGEATGRACSPRRARRSRCVDSRRGRRWRPRRPPSASAVPGAQVLALAGDLTRRERRPGASWTTASARWARSTRSSTWRACASTRRWPTRTPRTGSASSASMCSPPPTAARPALPRAPRVGAGHHRQRLVRLRGHGPGRHGPVRHDQGGGARLHAGARRGRGPARHARERGVPGRRPSRPTTSGAPREKGVSEAELRTSARTTICSDAGRSRARSRSRSCFSPGTSRPS